MLKSIISNMSIFKRTSLNKKSNHSENNISVNLEKKIRINKYDNLRGLAIILVVLTHLLGSFNGIVTYNEIYKLINVFIMPLFFFVSGILSKITLDSPIKAFKGLLIPYIIFTIIWIPYNIFILGGSFPKIPFFYPVYALWFLLSLFTMRLFLPILVKIKYIFWISLAIALIIGIFKVPNNFLGITRTLCFLPAFLVGYNYKHYKELITAIQIPKLKKLKKFKRKLIFIFLVVFLILVWIFTKDISIAAMHFKESYHSMDLRIAEGILIRTIIIFSGIIIALLLNYLMTNKYTFLTKIGIASLAIYILHPYITQISRAHFNFTLDPILIGFYIISLTIITVYILSRDFVSKTMNKIINTSTKMIISNNEDGKNKNLLNSKYSIYLNKFRSFYKKS